MPLWLAKAISALILTLVGFLGCGMPFFAKNLARNKVFIDLASAFGGGAFIGLALFHLIPEASGQMSGTHSHSHSHSHEDDGDDDDDDDAHHHPSPLLTWDVFGLPLNPAFVLMFLGFSLILFVERVAFSSEKVEALHAHDHGHEGEHDHSHSHSHVEARQSLVHVASSQTRRSRVIRRSSVSPPLDNQNLIPDEDVAINDPLLNAGRQVVDNTEENTRAMYASRSRLHSLVGSQILAEADLDHSMNLVDVPAELIKNNGKDIQVGGSALTAYMMMVALSIHNVFEGIVVGSASSERTAFMLCLSIVFHHTVAGLALSMGFVKQNVHNGFKARVALAIFVFSLPIGVAIGIGLSSADEVVGCVANCIAAGTILYVATCEVIAEEFAAGRRRRSKFAAYLFGALLLLVLSALHEKWGHDEE